MADGEDVVAVDESQPLVHESAHKKRSGSSASAGGGSSSSSRAKPGPVGDPDCLTPEINKALRVMAAKPTEGGRGNAEAKEGFLLKKKRKADSWTKYFFRLDPNGTLSYYRSKDVRLSLPLSLAP